VLPNERAHCIDAGPSPRAYLPLLQKKVNDVAGNYLEREINCNLTRLSRLLRILRFHVHDLNLVPSTTDYRRWGKGRKQRLRFTKTGDARLEVAYATHFVWPGKSPFHPPTRPDRLTDHMSAGSRP